jgi:hypothetical protein
MAVSQWLFGRWFDEFVSVEVNIGIIGILESRMHGSRRTNGVSGCLMAALHARQAQDRSLLECQTSDLFREN